MNDNTGCHWQHSPNISGSLLPRNFRIAFPGSLVVQSGHTASLANELGVQETSWHLILQNFSLSDKSWPYSRWWLLIELGSLSDGDKAGFPLTRYDDKLKANTFCFNPLEF